MEPDIKPSHDTVSLKGDFWVFHSFHEQFSSMIHLLPPIFYFVIERLKPEPLQRLHMQPEARTSRLDLIHSWLDLIQMRLNFIHSLSDLIHIWQYLIHSCSVAYPYPKPYPKENIFFFRDPYPY